MDRSRVTRAGVVVPRAAGGAASGSPTRGQARGRKWRRTGCNLFVPADVDPTLPDQRITEAVLAAPGCAATGWAALHWLGARWFGGLDPSGAPLPVPLAAGDRRGTRRRDGARLSEDWLFADDILVIDGLPITTPERSVSWEVRRAGSLAAAVRIIDMAAYSDLIDLCSFAEYVARLPVRPGIKLLRQAVDLANENSWSPKESEMRVLWVIDGRHPSPLCNVPIFNLNGAHLLTPDLFDPLAWVAGEYNGGVHADDAPRARDLDREETYRRLGIESVAMMRSDLSSPWRFLGRAQSAYDRAAARGRSDRRWTMDVPDWWVDTSTVAARRGLTAEQRERWLRYRGPEVRLTWHFG